MEKLIRFRLSVKLLDSTEFNVFVNKFGKDQIISLLLKGFLFMKQHSQNANNEMINVNNIISDIIQSRDINKSSKSNENTINNNELLKINKLPSVLIRECGSYLNIIDYINFSQSDGLIYVSCNSACSLQSLNMEKNGYPNNLNKFPLLKTIHFIPDDFNKKYNNCSFVLNNLNCLSLDMDFSNNHSEIEKFMNMNCVDFAQITTLKLLDFGSCYELYNFDSFCELLNKFPNINCLGIRDIYFDEFKDENNTISKLLPQLNKFIFISEDINANLFRDKLIQTHAKQIIHLNYDEQIKILDCDSIKSLKLKDLVVNGPNINTLSQLIKQSPQLQCVFMNPAISSNEEMIKNIIKSLYTKYSKMNKIKIHLWHHELDKIIQWEEIGLSDSECIKRNYLKIMLNVHYQKTKISINQIKLHLVRMVNALSLCTKHFMIIFILYGDINTIDINQKIELVNSLKKRCLIVEDIITDAHGGKNQRIIVSNNGCAINGYQLTK